MEQFTHRELLVIYIMASEVRDGWESIIEPTEIDNVIGKSKKLLEEGKVNA